MVIPIEGDLANNFCANVTIIKLRKDRLQILLTILFAQKLEWT